jgi:hypothetical protein
VKTQDFFKQILKHHITSMASTASTATTAATSSEVCPSERCLIHAAKISIKEDRPIMLDYYAESVSKKAFLGNNTATNEKMLIKSPEEYTSNIQKILKVGDDLIVLTENSIYLVSAKIETRKVSV